VSEPVTESLDATRLLFDLQRVNDIAQSFAGCLDPVAIANAVTDGLVNKFDCAFARIWLISADRTHLKLVASSGLYTRTDGSFATVPMGAYKVGKIAQNLVSFLSNNLPQESWVKDRDWAIANQIRGFAGYPLMSGAQVVGVLAVFSHRAMASEFLEVLQVLCTTAGSVLQTVLTYQQDRQFWLQEKQSWQSHPPHFSFHQLPLSDQLAMILRETRLKLIGTEQPLPYILTAVFLQAAETLNQLSCNYCRLLYTPDAVMLEASVTPPSAEEPKSASSKSDIALTLATEQVWVRSQFGLLCNTIATLGGLLQSQVDRHPKMIQVQIKLPLVPDAATEDQPLSDREREILLLLGQGLRDRDIADRLVISESTVKFHLNNVLAKLKARTRYQAIYQAMKQGWLV
jgi:DNA-binding CsgD family transcriptional regulator